MSELGVRLEPDESGSSERTGDKGTLLHFCFPWLSPSLPLTTVVIIGWLQSVDCFEGFLSVILSSNFDAKNFHERAALHIASGRFRGSYKGTLRGRAVGEVAATTTEGGTIPPRQRVSSFRILCPTRYAMPCWKETDRHTRRMF